MDGGQEFVKIKSDIFHIILLKLYHQLNDFADSLNFLKKINLFIYFLIFFLYLKYFLLKVN